MAIDFSFVSQHLDGSADCAFLQRNHTVMVYRGGRVQAKEYELERGASRYVEEPQPGSVWVLPAEQRGAALARGVTVAEYCQLTIPTALLGDRPISPTIGRDPLLYQLVERIYSVTGRDDAVARLLRETLNEAVRLHLGDRYGPPLDGSRDARTPTVLDARMQAQLREYLNDSLDTKTTLVEMARMVGMPIAKFTKAFAEAFHTTPHQYLLDQRVMRARTLLATSALPVTEIAAAVGFSTPSHFATTFKERMGVTPTQYRRQVSS